MSEKHQSPHERRGQPAPEDLPKLAYPSWRYHEDGRSQIIQSANEDAQLGAGWSDRPKGAAAPPDDIRHLDKPQPEDEQPELRPLPFPSWRYHTDGRSQLIQSKDEEKALGKGWSDAPEPSDPVTFHTVTTTQSVVTDVQNQVAGLPALPIVTTSRQVDPTLVNAKGEPVDDQTQQIIGGETLAERRAAQGDDADDDPAGERKPRGRPKKS